ncbi:uncharacterized protein LOC116444644, partial [Corvus moneduloides]|uniref:uncharacterized protein LOC116444644 n=1 Tax=Corvus moneduloides TaxID=1196302 RepID=UPI0013625761
MGASKASGVKSSSRKRKNELEKGQDKPKMLPVRKKKKKELECTVKPSMGKEKKKPSKVKEKPLQENIISSSLKQEAAGGRGLGSSLWNGIQAKEGAASGLEETQANLPQGPPVGLEDSSRSPDESQRTGPAVGEQPLETQNGTGVPSEGAAGGVGVASPSGGPLEMDLGLSAMRESEEKELDPLIPQQEEDSQAPKRKRGKKQEENKQERRLKR